MPEPERYLTRAQLAEVLGVSIATVDRLVAEGAPSHIWGRTARRLLVSEVQARTDGRGEGEAEEVAAAATELADTLETIFDQLLAEAKRSSCDCGTCRLRASSIAYAARLPRGRSTA